MNAHSLLVADAASDQDRLWFERHPSRETYVREFVPGELPLHAQSGDGVQCTVVKQIRPGARMRLPIYLSSIPSDTERAAVQVFRVALGREFGGDHA